MSVTIGAHEQARTQQTAAQILARREADHRSRGLVLREYQRTGSRWLIERMASGRGALLADEMGVGKTVQMAVALPEQRPIVVVAPASVKGVHLDHFRRWRPDYFVQILSGRGSFRWPLPGAVVVLNYDILPAELTPAPAGVVLIGDECHAVLNGQALRTKRFRALSRVVMKAGGVTIGLTGTPLQNREADLWGVLYSLGLHEEAFDSWPVFQRLFDAHKETVYVKRGTETRIDHTGRPVRDVTVYGKPSHEVAERLRRVSLRRRLDDVAPEIPPITFQRVEVDLPSDVRKICDEAMEMIRRRGINLDDVQELVKLTLPGMPGFELIAKARAALATAKIGVMQDLIADFEGNEEPAVVFCCHRTPIDAAGERKGWRTITGDVKPEERDRIVVDFQAGNLRGVAATIQAGGEGITLTRSRQVLMVDRWWGPMRNDQAIARVRRMTQTRPVFVTNLIARHPIDERVEELVWEKRVLIDATVEASAVPAPAPEAFHVEPRPEQGGLFG